VRRIDDTLQWLGAVRRSVTQLSTEPVALSVRGAAEGRWGHHRVMSAERLTWIDTHCHLDAPEFDRDPP
jgi:hypothetical protein